MDKRNEKEPVQKEGACMSNLNVSVGFVSRGKYAPTKTTGIKTRGNGAATKGTTARGPMA